MKRILVIEDEADIRESLVEILQLNGYEVMSACNGKVGMVMLSVYQPDLVISDIMMPELNGIEFLSLINKQRSIYSTHCIILSAVTDKDILRKAAEFGAVDILQKPFKMSKLMSAIQMAI